MNRNNYYQQRGRRGARRGRFGGYQNYNYQREGGRSQQSREIINKEEIIKTITEAVKKDMIQSVPKKNEEINCSDYTWDDFEMEFEKVEDKLRREERAAEEEDYDRIVYTDAWDAGKIMEFAFHYWDAQNIERDAIRRDNCDIILFGMYCTALSELFLYAQDDIIGVNGFTREDVRQAQYMLKTKKIPELIGDMLLGLRSIVIEESNTKVVLMPHTALDHMFLPLPRNEINVVGNNLQLNLRQACIIVREKFGQPGQPIPMVGVFVKNWMKDVCDVFLNRGAGTIQPDDLELIVGRRFWSKSYSESTMTANINGQVAIPYTFFWFDFWFRSNIDDSIDKWIQRYFIGFGNYWMFKARKKKHIPIIVDDIFTDTYIWTEESEKEKWIPWFTFGTVQGARGFRDVILQQVPGLMINTISERGMDRLTWLQWSRKQSMLCHGNGRALMC